MTSNYSGAFSTQKQSRSTSERKVIRTSSKPTSSQAKGSLSDRFRAISQGHNKTTTRPNRSGGIAKMTGVEGATINKSKNTSSAGDVEMRPARSGKVSKFHKNSRRSFRRPNHKGKKVTKESLDTELDSYMMKDSEIAKSVLDRELNEYMQDDTLSTTQ